MVEAERTLTLDHPLREVVGYLADFAHTEAWHPATVGCERVGGGPPAVGAEWHHVSRFRRRRTELRYRLIRLDDDRLTFVGRNGTVTSTQDMIFLALDGGTRLTYRARVDVQGLPRPAAPLLRRALERLGDEVVRQLPPALDRHLGPPTDG